jgi:hypothetical protein
MDLKDVMLSEVSVSAGQVLCGPTSTRSLKEPASQTEGTAVSARAGGGGGGWNQVEDTSEAKRLSESWAPEDATARLLLQRWR